MQLNKILVVDMSREYWKYFFAAVGTISSVVTLISFVFQLKVPDCIVIIQYILGVIGLSIAFAVWQTCVRPQHHYSYFLEYFKRCFDPENVSFYDRAEENDFLFMHEVQRSMEDELND